MRTYVLAVMLLAAILCIGAKCSSFPMVGGDDAASEACGTVLSDPTRATVSGATRAAAGAEIEVTLQDGKRARIPKNAPLDLPDDAPVLLPAGTRMDRSYTADILALVGVLAIAGLVAFVAVKTIAGRQPRAAPAAAKPRRRAAKAKRRRKPKPAPPAVAAGVTP